MLLLVSGCSKSESNPSTSEVVLYTSVDEPYVRPIIAEFERRTGIRVVLQTDTEANKSAGLAARLEAERDKPRADVWWGNEVFHTIRLAEAGVLDAYDSPAAADVSGKYKDVQHRWAGNALRARVIAIRPSPTSADGDDDATVSMKDLVDPAYRGKVAMARPTAGTTGGHVATLYALWGRERFLDYMTKLRANGVKLLGGNGPVAEAVGRGEVLLGLTDNDDVAAVRREGGQIGSVLPDQDGDGTLAIPTTVALVKGADDAEAAKKLIDYLLSAEVEKKLVDAQFASWSVRGGGDAAMRTMDVDYTAAARLMPEAVETAMKILEGRE